MYPHGSHQFAYDDRWRIVAMYEDDAASDVPTEQFWYQNAGVSGMSGSSYIDDVILRDRDTDGNGTLDERRYYLQNWHHDVVAIIDTSGSIVERANYDAYGSPIGTFTGIGNRKGYAGYEYDTELGDIYHVRVRVYRSDIGRWSQRDRIDVAVDLSLYSYTAGRPVTEADPSGLIRVLVRQCQEHVDDVHGDCGNLDCRREFYLSGPNPCMRGSGFYIQKIDVRAHCTECPPWGAFEFSRLRYWELFRPRPEFMHAPSGCDFFTFDSHPATWGTASISGDIQFFCLSDIIPFLTMFELLHGPFAGWQDGVVGSLGNCGDFSSGLAKHTLREPRWWSRATHAAYPAIRSATTEWCCCPDPRPSFNCHCSPPAEPFNPE